MSSFPQITRVRHETRRRQLTVSRIERLAPKMLRIVFGGAELAGFTSLGFDDHVKLFFPEGGVSPSMRDFTPRRYDEAARELWIDFYLHDAGPAATWASRAAVGEPLSIGGPRGSSVISLEGIDTHVLVGDETALPAIGRRLEELPAEARALLVIESDGGSDSYPLGAESGARFDIVRAVRRDIPGDGLIGALTTVQIPSARSFIWVATESQAARAIRRYLVNERGLDKHWIKAAGYWQRGVVGSHDVIQDDN